MSNLIRISEPASLALHAIAALARWADRRWSNHEIAAKLEVSEHHLAKVMQELARARIVDSARGPQGGFVLNRPATEITLLEVFEAVDGPVGEPECLLRKRTCDGEGCAVGRLVFSAHEQIRETLSETTVARMAEGFSALSDE